MWKYWPDRGGDPRLVTWGEPVFPCKVLILGIFIGAIVGGLLSSFITYVLCL